MSHHPKNILGINLFDYRKMTPVVFNQTMANSVSRLNEATKNLQESTKLLQKQIKDAKK